MQEKISIIVPVYNVEEYLEQCLESIVKQTYKNIEIIIIEDGSTDNSKTICEQYERKYHNIRLICQNNQGVAKARKNAAKFVTGEYVGFVDSDDYVDLDYFEQLISVAEEVDIVTSGYRKLYHHCCSDFYDKIPSGVYRECDEVSYIYDNMIFFQNGKDRGITPYIWNKLYKANIVEKVFEEIDDDILIGEDSDFLYRYLLKCSTIRISNICGYNYRLRLSSSMHQACKGYLRSVNDLYYGLEEVFCMHSQKAKLMSQLQIWISGMISNATVMMGFAPEAQNYTYIFPYVNLLIDKKIVLYGAGKVGQNYYMQIKKFAQSELVLWVDGNFAQYDSVMGIDIVSPLEITANTFDYVIVAVLDENVANDIKKNLIEMGISSEEILWKPPIEIYR